MILVGVVGGIARQSLMAFAMGIGGGMGLYNSPTWLSRSCPQHWNMPTRSPRQQSTSPMGSGLRHHHSPDARHMKNRAADGLPYFFINSQIFFSMCSKKDTNTAGLSKAVP